jgi:preprotein translocase subunit Sec61beta
VEKAPPVSRLSVSLRRSNAARNERFTRLRLLEYGMSSGENTGGLMSSAGLVRYFDAEDRNAIRIDPRTIVAVGVVFGVFIQLLSVTT